MPGSHGRPRPRLSRHERAITDYYRVLLGLDSIPYAGRIAKVIALRPPGGDDLLSRAVPPMRANAEAYARAIARAVATFRAMECLIALRRWQLTHRGSPSNLAAAIKGTPLKAVPIDPYDGKPMRLAMLDGEPVVYSVGRDGKDDGGRIDANRDMRPGDLIYRPRPMGSPR